MVRRRVNIPSPSPSIPVLVEKLVQSIAPDLDQKWQLASLLHDAPEYVIGDMITPFKGVLGDRYKDIEARLEAAVHIRFLDYQRRFPITWKRRSSGRTDGSLA